MGNAVCMLIFLISWNVYQYSSMVCLWRDSPSANLYLLLGSLCCYILRFSVCIQESDRSLLRWYAEKPIYLCSFVILLSHVESNFCIRLVAPVCLEWVFLCR